MRSLLAAVLLVGCSDGATAPRVRPTTASLSISAAISSQAATQVLLVALWSSQATEGLPYEPDSSSSYYFHAGVLGTRLVSLADSANSVELPIDLAPCLRDSLVLEYINGQELDRNTCPYVYIDAMLFSGSIPNVRNIADLDSIRESRYVNNVYTGPILDEDYFGPLAVSVGGIASDNERVLQLHEVSYIQTDSSSVTMALGQSRTVTAKPVYQSGATVSGRTITWSSLDAKIATVDANGRITGTGLGSTYVLASSGGRDGYVYVTVQSPPIPDKTP